MLDLIRNYHQARGLKWPTASQALLWAYTEMAEVTELLLIREGGWTRNNPQDKPQFSKEQLATELGDAIMMLLVTGIVEGVDPIEALREKMEAHL